MQGRLDKGEWTPLNGNTQQSEKINLAEKHQLEVGRERILRELSRVERRLQTLDAVEVGDATTATQLTDLWPNETDLVGGHMDVFDKSGNLIRSLSITGPNLERWLIDADVKPSRCESRINATGRRGQG